MGWVVVGGKNRSIGFQDPSPTWPSQPYAIVQGTGGGIQMNCRGSLFLCLVLTPARARCFSQAARWVYLNSIPQVYTFQSLGGHFDIFRYMRFKNRRIEAACTRLSGRLYGAVAITRHRSPCRVPRRANSASISFISSSLRCNHKGATTCSRCPFPATR